MNQVHALRVVVLQLPRPQRKITSAADTPKRTQKHMTCACFFSPRARRQVREAMRRKQAFSEHHQSDLKESYMSTAAKNVARARQQRGQHNTSAKQNVAQTRKICWTAAAAATRPQLQFAWPHSFAHPIFAKKPTQLLVWHREENVESMWWRNAIVVVVAPRFVLFPATSTNRIVVVDGEGHHHHRQQ